MKNQYTRHGDNPKETVPFTVDLQREEQPSETDMVSNDFLNFQFNGATESLDPFEAYDGNSFLRRFTFRIKPLSSLVILY